MAEGPRHYDAAHETLYRKRGSSYKVAWERSLDVAREASKDMVGSILDLGCGLGFLAKFARGDYLGIDFSPYSVRTARAIGWNPKAKFMRGDICDLPDVGRFDTVAMLEVLEHLEDRAGAVETAKRLARRRVVVSVPKGRSRSGDHVWNDITHEDMLALLGPGTTCRPYRRKWIAVWEAEP